MFEVAQICFLLSATPWIYISICHLRSGSSTSEDQVVKCIFWLTSLKFHLF